ncbi:MAG TPA: DNA-processing protein DprA [Burkholderiales bacterium]|nr:DNA-processing protein DprA [Burkholderiales bacterium]
MANRDTEAWLALTLIPGLGPESARRLLAAFGDPREVLEAPAGALVPAAGRELARAIADGPDPARLAGALAWCDAPGNGIVTWADTDYPRLLLNTADPPPLLYLKGRRELLGAPALAVVGSRNATPQGLANSEAFARAISDAGLAIVSGLALGIDAAAHRGGLQGAGSSIAVVGTGLDIVYPAANRALAHELAARGLLLSEFPLRMPAMAGNFPRRNRVISGLALGVLVAEAAVKSGSLITARMALEQGREVFAIPGSIHSPMSRGCHMLIKQGAKLAESAGDILEELGHAAPGNTASVAGEAAHPLVPHLGFDPVDVDTLCARSGLPVERVSAALLELELAGRVAPLPGGKYQRLK